jgi:hypothetical protein
MVPVTVERRVKGDLVSVQLWLDNTTLLKKAQGRAPDVDKWNRQVYRQRVFDDLVGNIDRNEGNLLIDADWNLILIDHSRAFTATASMPFPLTRIDRPFFDALKALDRNALSKEIGPLLEAGALPALLKRRDLIVKTFEKLAAEQGEAKVILP